MTNLRYVRASVKLVTIKISLCYNIHQTGCNSYKQYVVSMLLQHLFVVTILLQHISLVTMQIGCNNLKIKYLLLQRLRNVVTQILVATMNGICKSSSVSFSSSTCPWAPSPNSGAHESMREMKDV